MFASTTGPAACSRHALVTRWLSTRSPQPPPPPPSRRRGAFRGARGRVRYVAPVASADTPKMWVPPDAFGGETPERVVANQLRSLFTYIAAHIVLGQTMNLSPKINTPDGASLADADGASAAAKVASDYDRLHAYLAEHPVRNGDEWLRGLSRVAPNLAQRIAVVRLAYGSGDFEWENARRLSVQGMEEGNLSMMRDWARTAFAVDASSGQDTA